jgi:hypothetical protein
VSLPFSFASSLSFPETSSWRPSQPTNAARFPIGSDGLRTSRLVAKAAIVRFARQLLDEQPSIVAEFCGRSRGAVRAGRGKFLF